ncbi:MAG: aspartyl protease family protein, partial [Terricaulis sp.]
TPTGTARLQGASGAVDANMYSLDAVEIAGLRRDRQVAVQTPPDAVSAATHAGVLGARTFANTRLEFDFVSNRLNIDTSTTRVPLENSVNVEFRHGMFALAPVSIAGLNATAVIDTGARVTVANRPLRDALGFRENDPRLSDVEPIGGATGHRTPTVAAEVTPVLIAGHDFGALNLNFAELSVFAALQLTEAPSLILGMDILRRANALILDYTSSTLALRR